MLDLKLFAALVLILGTESLVATNEPPMCPEPPVVVPGDPTVTCELAALMPHAPLAADECKALMNLFQVVAVANPQASRDGDEQMNCVEIRSELSRMQTLDGSQAVRFEHSMVAVAQDLSESMRSNPRLGRLVQLGAARDCSDG